MRASTDIPRRRRRGSTRGRILLIVALAALFFLATSLRGIAGFYTDFLWFDSLGFSSVFWGTLRAQLALAVIFTGVFFVLIYVNLLIADRIAPKFRPQGPEDDLLERYHDVIDRRQGLVRLLISLGIALLFGIPAYGHWSEWLLFTNSVPFGETDPLFHTDISFYVFRLPFITYVVDWLFGALIFVLIVTAVAHYLNGGIRFQSALQRVTPQVKAHLSVLLGLLALVKAADYWFQQYELTLSTRGVIDGAGYTAVNAELPALRLLILISLAAFVAFIANIWQRGWVLPVVTISLWAFAALAAGAIYPALVQRFQVEPAESSKEQPYIADNIENTRAAMAMTGVETQSFEFDAELTADQLLDNRETIENIRLLDPNVVGDTYRRLQEQRGFYAFPNLDVDRYTVAETDAEGATSDRTTQVVLGARELDTPGIPTKSWEAEHVAYTHGYGVALAPANETTQGGRPDFLIRDVPVEVDDRLPETASVEQPQLYIGDGLPGYSIVDTERVEIDYTDAEGQAVPVEKTPNGGVRASGTGIAGFFRRASFALRFGEIEPLISDFITADSRMFYIRDVRGRVQKVAPFLSLDSDPYPVVTPDGKVVYVADAYTTTNQYPYAEQADNEQLPETSGLQHRFNYARNSVKVVVEAYTGDVTLYVMPGIPNGKGETEPDPIVRAWRKAFPDLFADFDDMDPFLKEHLRYPEDLFRVQTNMWGRYHIDDPTQWYSNSGGWAVAQDPGTKVDADAPTAVTNAEGQAVDTRKKRIDPYYLQMQLPDENDGQFVLLRPYVPISEGDTQEVLTSFMVAKSDPESYGQLKVYELTDQTIDGPAIVQSNILSTDEISREISLLNQEGSDVRFGNLLLVPVDQAILYVRPLYVQARGNTAVPELRQVIVAFGEDVVMEPTLLEALTQIFDGEGELAALTEILGDELAPPTDPDEPTPPDETPGEDDGADDTVASLLADADALLSDARDSLLAGELGDYQDKVEQAQEKIKSALELAGQDAGSGAGDGGGEGGGGGGGTTTTESPPDDTTTTAEPDEA
jgi:hypothetical protein